MLIVEVPFSDGTGGKLRPAVVISSLATNAVRMDVIVMPVTSQAVRTGDISFDWHHAELQQVSVIKLQCWTVAKPKAVERVGKMKPKDFTVVKKALAKMFDIG